MPADLTDALHGIARTIASLAARDAGLRDELRGLAGELLEALDAVEEVESGDAPAERGETDGAPVEAAPAGEHPQAVRQDSSSDATTGPETAPATAPRDEPDEMPRAPLPELTLGQPRPLPAEPAATDSAEPGWPEHWMEPADHDLSVIETRCRLKADACHWAATRRRLFLEKVDFQTEIAPRDEEIISRARNLPDCYLWMCHPSGPSPEDPREYDELAHCFETLADAVALMRRVQEERELHGSEFEASLDLLAEAQSTVRTAVDRIDGPSRETDQFAVYNWLRRVTRDEHVYVQRYMRIDDPADPARREDLAARIEEVDNRLQEQQRQVRLRRKLLGKVRHKVSVLSDSADSAAHEWPGLARTVDELVADGLAPSNRELRELLIPVVDDLPELDDVPAGFALVLREIDRYLATSPPHERSREVVVTPEVQQVRQLLEGHSLVLIGGDRRPGAAEALEKAFGLDTLHWIETREHQPIDGFAPYVARPDVVAVILAIRWTSHSFGDVKDFCDTYGKPLVRLPAGYNPNQVAAQILAQCSDRLGEIG